MPDNNVILLRLVPEVRFASLRPFYDRDQSFGMERVCQFTRSKIGWSGVEICVENFVSLRLSSKQQ